MSGVDDEETMMTATTYPVNVPAEAWGFVERLGLRESFENYLAMAGEFYGPFIAMTVEYDPCDPTFQDEQMSLRVDTLPGGRSGGDADLEWMSLAGRRFGPVLSTRLTPVSRLAAPGPVRG